MKRHLAQCACNLLWVKMLSRLPFPSSYTRVKLSFYEWLLITFFFRKV